MADKKPRTRRQIHAGHQWRVVMCDIPPHRAKLICEDCPHNEFIDWVSVKNT